jgi:hypothetical protein
MDFADGRQEAAIEASGACPTNSYVNPLVEAPVHEAKTVDLRPDDIGVANKEYRNSLNQGSPCRFGWRREP